MDQGAEVVIAAQEIAEPLVVGTANQMVRGRRTHVGIDQQHAAASSPDCHRQRERRRRFAFAFLRAGHNHRLGQAVAGRKGKHRADAEIGFCELGRSNAQLDGRFASDPGNTAEQRQTEGQSDILRIADPLVDLLESKNDQGGKDNAEQERKADVALHIG